MPRRTGLVPVVWRGSLDNSCRLDTVLGCSPLSNVDKVARSLAERCQVPGLTWRRVNEWRKKARAPRLSLVVRATRVRCGARPWCPRDFWGHKGGSGRAPAGSRPARPRTAAHLGPRLIASRPATGRRHACLSGAAPPAPLCSCAVSAQQPNLIQFSFCAMQVGRVQVSTAWRVWG